jgi:AcrR family transcriptional regulator
VGVVKDNIQERIIQAAKTLFGRHGFRKTSLSDIAAELRMGKSSLYHYFSSKEELFRAVVQAEMNVLSRRVQEAVDKETQPEAKLKAFVLTRMRVAKELANAYATLHEEYLDQLGFVERFREEAFQAEVEMIRRILEEGVEAGVFEVADAGIAAYAIALALKGLEYPWLLKSEKRSIEHDLDILLDMLMKAVRK